MKLFKNKKNRILAAVLAAVITVTSFAIGMSPTFAAKPDTIVRLTQPNNYVVVRKGGNTTISVTNISKVDSSDKTIATVVVTNNKYLTVAGLKAGVSGISYGNKIGGVMSEAVQVVDANAITGYDLPNGGNGYLQEPRALALSNNDLDINYYKTDAPARSDVGVRTPSEKNLNADENNYKQDNTLASQVTWESLNKDVVNAQLVPVGKGVTVLVGTFIDRWGVTHTIHYLFGVGVIPGNSAMNDLFDAINKGKEIQKDANANPGKYDTDKLIDLDNAIKEGERVLEDPASKDSDYTDAAKEIEDAINALKPGSGTGGNGPIELIPDKDNNGGPNDKWYRPVKRPSHVYEVVDKDGNPRRPPEYVLDTDRDGNPNTGEKRPIYGPKDGIFYLEDPEGSNIYKKLDDDGQVLDDGAIWGGNDKSFGSGDDRPAIKNDSRWYASLGQNIFQEINIGSGYLTGPLIGGGPNSKPGDALNLTTGNIFLHDDDKYYAGPFEDADGGAYYVGDKRTSRDGIQSFNYSVMLTVHTSDQKYYLNNDGEMVTTKPVAPPIEPEMVLGISIAGPTTVEASTQMTAFEYTATVTGSGVITDRVNWTVIGIPGAVMMPSLNSKTAYLRLPANAMGQAIITVSAVGDETATQSYEVTVKNPATWANTPEGGEFTADGIEWIVIGRGLGESGNDIMIMTKYVHSAGSVKFSSTGYTCAYKDSFLKSAVDSFYGQLGELRPYAIIPTFNKTGAATETTTSSGNKAGATMSGVLFPLSLAEVTALSNSLKIGRDAVNHTKAVTWWTRSPNSSCYSYCVNEKGEISTPFVSHYQGLRLALIVNFESQP